MPNRSRFRTLADTQGHVDALASIANHTRPLAELLERATPNADTRTAQETILLLQCITDMTHALQLDTETVTARFRVWAMGSAKPWWTLYQQVMQRDRHALKQMMREDSH